ncbi:MAG: carbamoyltransferase N-terminal domain-containing protein [Planctomycetota bacterium]
MDVLGLSFHYHDAAAALVADDRIVAAAAEERFSRVKHDSGFPRLAVDFALERAGRTATDLDAVVFYEKPLAKLERILTTAAATFPRSSGVFRHAMQKWLGEKLWVKSLIRRELGVPASRILFCDHHVSHAASAFFTSPFEDAAILTVDGAGEWTTATMGVGRGGKVEILRELRFPHSLGLLYSAFTAYCGFEINEGEYKLMGMHPYGEPRFVDKILEMVRLGEDGGLHHDMRYFAYHRSPRESLTRAFGEHFGKPPRDPAKGDKSLDPFYCDVAASIQRVTEIVLFKMIGHLARETGSRNLCLAGGVALNSVANFKLLRDGPFDDVYINPAPGDDGASLGAALWARHHVFEEARLPALDHAYLGSEYGDDEIGAWLRSRDIPHRHVPDDEEFLAEVARRLAEGQVVGWFRGRFEWGPRALGSRSILADPRRAEMKDLLNAKIKFREAFRPFAPSVLEERACDFFDYEAGRTSLPGRFMLYVAPVREDKRDVIPAITHVDGSGRLQTVSRDTNPAYHRLIELFGERTGVPVVMNTSFNLKGEPIVEHPAHAFNTFSRSGMDVLAVGNHLVEASAKRELEDVRFELRHRGDSVAQMVT